MAYLVFRIDFVNFSGKFVLHVAKKVIFGCIFRERIVYGNRDFSVLRKPLFFHIFDGNNAPNVRGLTVKGKRLRDFHHHRRFIYLLPLGKRGKTSDFIDH